MGKIIKKTKEKHENAQSCIHAVGIDRCHLIGQGPWRQGDQTQSVLRLRLQHGATKTHDNQAIASSWQRCLPKSRFEVELRWHRRCFPQWLLHEHDQIIAKKRGNWWGSPELPVYVEARMCLHQVGAIQPVHVLQLGLWCRYHDSRAIRFHRYGQAMLLGFHWYPLEETTTSWVDSSK